MFLTYQTIHIFLEKENKIYFKVSSADITKTRLFKYIENFTTKKLKFSAEKL